MRVLIVKTSSLGDIIHTLPALSDAAKVYPEIQFDWIVEESFKAIPSWHPHVDRVIPLAFRRWRKKGWQAFYRGEMRALLKEVRRHSYDKIIDAQGLLKSVFLSLFCRGRRSGFDWSSAREPLASMFYHQHAKASWNDHAVRRLRLLFAQSLGYECHDSVPDYGIDKTRLWNSEKISETSYTDPILIHPHNTKPYCVFLHGTTWETKHWPEASWISLGQKLIHSGYSLKLLWGSKSEQERAQRIALAVPGEVEVMPKMGLNEIAQLLSNAKAVISLDTGLGHLAAALEVPTLSLYASTDPKCTGLMGKHQLHLSVNATLFPCAPCFSKTCVMAEKYPQDRGTFPPCFSTLDPDRVWQHFETHLKRCYA